MPGDRGPFHSAALRGALWITLIALLTTGAALTVQYLQTTRLLQERAQLLVDDEAASLIARYDDDGLDGVETAINRQAGLPRLNEFFPCLRHPMARRLPAICLVGQRGSRLPAFTAFRPKS